ncbi:unnamed protein product [Pylaiella littoralis]
MGVRLQLLAGLGCIACATGLPQPGPVFGQPDAEPAAAATGAGGVLDGDASLGVVADLVLGVLGDGVAEAGDGYGGDGAGDVEERFMDQRVDHFNRQESRTFPQRYFINRRYWAKSIDNAPVFLCIGGEGPALDASVLSASVHCNDMLELAPKHHALLVAVEHRYYGKSNPFDNWETESLQWLSSQQALADLAAFHGYLVSVEGLNGSEKWVTWGGSYPGMLAGWARLKFPNLFHAAVSSSSPLKAKLNFPQYTELMRDSLASDAEGVGGSEKCAKAIAKGHSSIGGLLQTQKGRLELVEIFELCDDTSLEQESARVLFAGDGVVMLPIQENDPACNTTLCNIKAVCDVMTHNDKRSEASQSQAFLPSAIRKIQRNLPSNGDRGHEPPSPCESFPPSDIRDSAAGGLRGSSSLAMMSDPTDASNPNRAWLYQTCTEFGFYQASHASFASSCLLTCEIGSRCPFTQGLHTLNLDLRICQEAFGIEAKHVRKQISYTNLYYGGRKPRGSRVIFPNGSIDPWHALGVLESPMPELPVIYVEGASHHFWTHPSKPTDSSDVAKARMEIWKQVTEWLDEDDDD